MATFLYRLGRLAATRAWIVVLAWALLLAGVAGAAATLRKPFTSALTIPGTEFQTVLDDLEKALPKAAGGSSTIVLSSTTGKAFTSEQRDLVADVTKRWSAIKGVDQASDPFAQQQELDDAKTKLADGARKLREGEEAIASNTKKLAQAAKQVADGERALQENAAKLATGKRQLAAAQAQLDAGQRQIDANSAKLAAAAKKLKTSAAKLASGKKQLATARQQISSGETQIAAARKQIAAGKAQIAEARQQVSGGEQQIAGARAQLADGRAQLAQARAQTDALASQLGDSDPQVVAARAQLAAQESQLNASQVQIDQQAAQLSATRKTLDSKSAQLTAGTKKLNTKAKQLAAGKATLKKKSAQLAAGEKKLKAGQAQVKAGQKKLAAAQAKLDKGQATINANRAKLAAGEKQLAAGRAQIAEAKATIADGTRQLAKAKKQIVSATSDLARGESQLALTEGLRMVSESGKVALAGITFDTSMQEVADATKDGIYQAATALTTAGIRADYAKDLSESLSFAGPGEAIGVIVAFLILFVMLGSLVAAGLPLLTALVGVAVGLLGAVTLTHWVPMTDVTPVLALMLGLAVGIDYALFLVNRHREQLAGGMGLRESIGVATGTAGSAVLFAGLTVIVALAALTLAGIPFLGTMGLVAAATVAVAVLVSLTLTPALLALIGDRILSRRARRTIQERLAAQDAAADDEDAIERSGHEIHDAAAHGGRGQGWGGFVTRHPIVTLAATTVVLGVMAIPAASLRLGLPDGSSEAPDSTAYRAYSLTAEAFGAGQNGPILAVAKVDPAVAGKLSSSELTDLEIDVAQRLKATEDVRYVVPAAHSADQRTLILQIVPDGGPNDQTTTSLIRQLRTDRDTIVAKTAVDSIGFAGSTVANIDISERLAGALPGYLAVVVGISLILLLLVFRSIVVPVLATAGFLLSIAAAFGAVVAVYQWGWLGSLLGVHHPGVILSFLPTLAIGILFGLAMDYQMFLVSGMREAWSHGHTAHTAVRTGFAHGARVVTAAALIMTSVFASFVFSHLAMVRPIGFALAIGVLIDAFLVRMTAIPAVMHIFGERAWYLPRWLDRLLPDLDVEGTKLAAARARGRHALEEEAGLPAPAGEA